MATTPILHGNSTRRHVGAHAPDSVAASARKHWRLTGHGERMQLAVTYPDYDTIVVHVVGEIDASTVPALTEVVELKLASSLRHFVLDLSQVSFFGVAGLEALDYAMVAGEHNQASVSVLSGPRCIERALRAGGPRFQQLASTSAATAPATADVYVPEELRAIS